VIAINNPNSIRPDSNLVDTNSVSNPPNPQTEAIPTGISLNDSSLTLGVASTPIKVIANLYPSNAVGVITFTSDNELTATIDSTGTLTPQGEGVAHIIVSIQGYPELKDTLRVTVIIPPAIQSITLARPAPELYVGGPSANLSISHAPANLTLIPTFASSNTEVVSISNNGTLKAVAQGSAIITVSASGNANVQDTLHVTAIKDAPILDAGVDQSVAVGVAVTFQVAATQEFGTLELSWDFNGDSIPEGSSTQSPAAATFTYNAIGEYQVVFIAKDGEGNLTRLTRRIRVGKGGPLILLTSPQADTIINQTEITVHYTADGSTASQVFTDLKEGENALVVRASNPSGEDSVTVKVTVDTQNPEVVITSPVDGKATTLTSIQVFWTVDGVSQTFQTFENLSANDGPQVITRSFTDAAVNSDSASVTVNVDRTAPIVIITSPSEGSVTNQDSIPVVWTVVGVTQTTQPSQTLSAGDGPKTITRSFTDAAGNPGTASIQITLDKAVPAGPTLTAMPVSPARTTAASSHAWTWSGTAPFEWRLSTTNSQTGTGTAITGNTYSRTGILADGTWYFQVRQRNAAGTWSSWATASLVVDNTAPSAPVVSRNAANSNAPRWTWTTGGGGNDTFRYRWNGDASYLGEGTAKVFAPTSGNDGTYNLCVSEKDAIGYGAEACQSIGVDRTLPTLAITSNVSAELMVTSINPTFSGTVSDANLERVECRFGTGNSFVNANVTGSNWSCTPTLGDGDINVTMTAFDRATNSASAAAVTVHKRSKVVFVRKNRTGNGTSWANAIGSIEEALSPEVTLMPGSEVWVSAGTYTSTKDVDIYKFTSNTSIIGGFSISGAPFNRSDATTSNPVHMDAKSLIIGWFGFEANPINNLTLSGIIFNGQFHNPQESKVYISNSTGIVIDKCSFINFRGDIPLLIYQGSNVTIKSTVFNNNNTGTYGAIMVGFNGTEGIAEFIDCTITGNTSDNSSYAGGITIGQFSSVTLTNCTVSGNKISTKEWPSETITLSPMNINVWSSGQLFHTGLILPEGGSTVSGSGIVSPHIP
jgi:hypothetical protein